MAKTSTERYRKFSQTHQSDEIKARRLRKDAENKRKKRAKPVTLQQLKVRRQMTLERVRKYRAKKSQQQIRFELLILTAIGLEIN